MPVLQPVVVHRGPRRNVAVGGFAAARGFEIAAYVDDTTARESVRPALPELIAEAYADARRAASAETGLAIADFPETPTPDFEQSLQAALAGEDFGGEAVIQEAATADDLGRNPRGD
jgi:hypothetical protein